MHNIFNSFWIKDEVLIGDYFININNVISWIYCEVALVLIIEYPYDKVLIQFGSIEEMLEDCNRLGSKIRL